MFRSLRFLAACLALAWAIAPGAHSARPEPPQETGFLNRRLELHGATYRFQVYLPEEWRRDVHKQWPIILFLHGRGERGSEGMWQTQIGLPQAVRDHPERWPFVIVMPQCPLPGYWTDPDMLSMAMAALDQEAAEFHGDPDRTYLSGLSLGGYAAWELARLYPHRWAAIAIAASGIFWSYAPERWQEASTLPAEYARALGRTPVWLFHGADDPLVPPRESELMFEAFKGSGGHIRLWLYQGLKHDCWTRAYNEPELPRWLLTHRVLAVPTPGTIAPESTALAERLLIPLHPPPSSSLPRCSTRLPASTATPGAIPSSPSSARAISSTKKTGRARSPSWPPNHQPHSSIPTAPAPPASPSSAILRAASPPSSSTTTATKSAGRSVPQPPAARKSLNKSAF